MEKVLKFKLSVTEAVLTDDGYDDGRVIECGEWCNIRVNPIIFNDVLENLSQKLLVELKKWSLS